MDSSMLTASSCSLVPNQTFSPTRNNARDHPSARLPQRHRSSRQRRLQSNSSIVISTSRIAQIERQLILKDVAARRIVRYLRLLLARKNAAKRIRRFIHKYHLNFRRNITMVKYLQRGRWTWRQADKVFALLLGWRARRYLKSHPFHDTSSQYLEMLRALLDMIGYYRYERFSMSEIQSQESRFAIFIRGDFRTANVSFLDQADRSIFVGIIHELLVCKESLRCLFAENRSWIGFPGYWHLKYFPKSNKKFSKRKDRLMNDAAATERTQARGRPCSRDSGRSCSAPQLKGLRRPRTTSRCLEEGSERGKQSEKFCPAMKLTAIRARSAQAIRAEPTTDMHTEQGLAEQRRQSLMADRRVRIGDLTMQIEKAMDELKVNTDKMRLNSKRASIFAESFSSNRLDTDPGLHADSPSKHAAMSPESRVELSPRQCVSPVRALRSPAKSSPLTNKWDGKLPGHFDFGFSLWFKGKRRTQISDELNREIARGPSDAFSQIKMQLMRSGSLLEDKSAV